MFRLVHIIHLNLKLGLEENDDICSIAVSIGSVACMRRKQERVSGSRNESVKLLCEYELFLTVLTTEV